MIKASLMMLGLLFSQITISKEITTLKFLTWESYISEELIAQFEQAFSANIELVYFENDESRNQIMAETSGVGFDLILVDDQELPNYIEQDWLATYNEKDLKHFDNLTDLWLLLVPNAQNYAIPYGFGTYGIAYRSDLIENVPNTWQELFFPSEELKGKLVMPPQVIELQALALAASGYGVNEDSVEALNKAQELLVNQQPYVKSYASPTFEADDLLLSQNALVAVAYSGDALYLQNINSNVKYTSPNDPSILWIDFITVAQHSKHKKLAFQFIDYLLQAEQSALNTNEIFTATFNRAALPFVDENIKNNPAIYYENLKNMELLRPPSMNYMRSAIKISNVIDLTL